MMPLHFRLVGLVVCFVLGEGPLMRVMASAQAVSSGSSAPAVQVTQFEPARGSVAPHGEAVSQLQFRHDGSQTRTFWVGYSVRDPAGRWYDVPAASVSVAPGEDAPPQRLAWRVPAAAEVASGAFLVRMSVWSAPPGAPGAQRLASLDAPESFRVQLSRSPVVYLRGRRWQAGSNRLGRGQVSPARVAAQEGGLALQLDAHHFVGAQIESEERVRFGSYAVRMKTADAPGSISAFFLYQDGRGDRADEIDVEIYNDGSRRVLFNVWVAGKQVHADEQRLPFDPAAAPHEYRIDWAANEIRFLVDGKLMRRWAGGHLPRNPMRLLVNAWWPKWLPRPAPHQQGEVWVEWVRP